MHDRFARSEWFRHDRFGLFIHWGAYAVPARGEWVRSFERISIEDYQRHVDAFQPDSFDPGAWADAAVAAGMKYAVLTAKHHDGFCLFDSKLTDYSTMHNGFGRDVVAEFLDAFRSRRLKVGRYYSMLEWHAPDYPAYDDAQGVTAEFNLNLLHRINRELGGTIPVSAFRHVARWNDTEARIEMHLEATRDVSFSVDGRPFAISKGKTIHTENSYKYGPRDARLLLRSAGWTPIGEWTDREGQFGLILAEARVVPAAP